jgi:imidazole glycerol-phosphate synthase subunit HisF
LVHDGGLVKTTQFRDAKYIGDPINAVKIFNEKECDELVVLDIDAATRGSEPDLKMIGRLAAECRMPLCYGGGVRTASAARRIVDLGVEKVAVSSSAVARPSLIGELAGEVGSQSVVVLLDVARHDRGGYEVRTHNGQNRTGKDPSAIAGQAESAGAGEIVVNSIDNDGMMRGYDLSLAAEMRAATRLPLTVLGGAGSLADIGQLIAVCGVVGAAAGSLFVFKGPYKAVLINYPSLAQREELIRTALPGEYDDSSTARTH